LLIILYSAEGRRDGVFPFHSRRIDVLASNNDSDCIVGLYVCIVCTSGCECVVTDGSLPPEHVRPATFFVSVTIVFLPFFLSIGLTA